MNKLYGTPCYGQRFCFDDKAFNSLQEAAERFLENMWDQLRQLSRDNVVTIEHIHLWKRVTDFKPRFKKILYLCVKYLIDNWKLLCPCVCCKSSLMVGVLY